MAALMSEIEPEISSCFPTATLSQLLEGTLESEQQMAVLSHLECCDICKQRLDHLSGQSSQQSNGFCGERLAADSAQAVITQVRSRGLPLFELTATDREADTVNEAVRKAQEQQDREFTADLLPDDQQLFELVDAIGEGGMAVVFRCRDTRLDRDVAVKVLRHRHVNNGEIAEQFRREAEIQKCLAHRQVAKVLESGTLRDGRPYIMMEYHPGRTLANIMRDDSVETYDVQHIFRQLCEIIAFTHRQGFVHRDLKPSNILVSSNEKVTVLDWGLGGNQTEPAGCKIPSCLTDSMPYASYQVAGTPGYIAPEQYRSAWAKPSADVYSLGVIFAELLTGKSLTTGLKLTDDENLAEQVSERILPAIRRSGVSDETVRLVARCLAIAPDNRPRDARQLLSEYDRLMNCGRETEYPYSRPRIIFESPAVGFGSIPNVHCSGPSGRVVGRIRRLPR